MDQQSTQQPEMPFQTGQQPAPFAPQQQAAPAPEPIQHQAQPAEAAPVPTPAPEVAAPAPEVAAPAPEPTPVPTTPEGYTYDGLKEQGWEDHVLVAHATYHVVVPDHIKQQILNSQAPAQPEPVQEAVQQPEVQAAPQTTTPVDPAMAEVPPEGDSLDQVLDGAVQNVQQQVSTSPLAGMSNFTPSAEQSAIVGEITPANFDNMMKVLKVLIKERSSDNIIIRDSRVKQGASDCVIEADMTTVLNYQGNTVNLDIINPKKYVDLFGQFRSQNNVFIVDDPSNNRFIITNGEIRLFLPKQESQLEQEVESIDTSNSVVLCTKTIDKDTRKIIKALAKDQDFVEFLIQDNTLKAMHIPDTAVYIYEEYLNDPQAGNLDETNAELTLRSSSFLPVDADAYDVVLYKLADGSYASVTDCKIGGQIDVKIIELTDETTGGNLLI